MIAHVGYSLINSSNVEVQFWSSSLGTFTSAPDRIFFPEEDTVIEGVQSCMAGNLFLDLPNGYKLVQRWIESNPTTDIDDFIGQTIEYRDGKTVVVYNYQTPTIPIYKEHIKSKVATKRWQVETGGITIDNVGYATDRESQIKYTAIAVAISQADPQTWSVNWKTNDGQFISLNSTQMMNRTNIVMGYVQGCFNREYAIQLEIDACSTVEELLLIDINSGWPEVTYVI